MDTVTVDIFGVAVAVPSSVARVWTGLPVVTGAPVGLIDRSEPGLAMAEAARLALAHTAHLCVHAAVVEAACGVVAFPGQSGLGKSTLTAQLLRAGLRYLSDESLVLDRRTGSVQPFARPLSLSAHSCRLLGIAESPDSSGETVVAFERFGQLSASRGPVTTVVLANRRPGPVELAVADPAEVMAELTRRSFNHFRDRASTVRVLASVVRRSRLLTASFGEAEDLARALAEELGRPAVPPR